MTATQTGRKMPTVKTVKRIDINTEDLLYQGLFATGLGALTLDMIFTFYTCVLPGGCYIQFASLKAQSTKLNEHAMAQIDTAISSPATYRVSFAAHHATKVFPSFSTLDALL
jgi:hypothetical protein